jgi:hypothetical protein
VLTFLPIGENKSGIVPVLQTFHAVKVRYELPNGSKRSYKVNKFMKPPGELIIPDLNKTVAQYFWVSCSRRRIRRQCLNLKCNRAKDFTAAIYFSEPPLCPFPS